MWNSVLAQTRAMKAMVTLAKEFKTFGYMRILPIVWRVVSNIYRYLRMLFDVEADCVLVNTGTCFVLFNTEADLVLFKICRGIELFRICRGIELFKISRGIELFKICLGIVRCKMGMAKSCFEHRVDTKL